MGRGIALCHACAGEPVWLQILVRLHESEARTVARLSRTVDAFGNIIAGPTSEHIDGTVDL